MMNDPLPTSSSQQTMSPPLNDTTNNSLATNKPIVGRYFSLGSSLRQFFNNQLLSDVIFIIENKKFFAHKLILAARSPYFYNLILVNCKNTNTLEVEIQDANAETFYNILEFVYTDTTVLKEDTVWDVYQGAKFYQLNNLLALCQDFIISTLNENNVFQYWKRSQDLNAVNLAEHCVLYIRNRYENMFKIGNINANSITVLTNPELVIQTLQQIARLEQKNRNTTRQQMTRNMLNVNNSALIKDESTQVKKEDTEIYESLQSYSFPPPSQPNPSQNTKAVPKDRRQPIVKGDVSNVITTTQTFELWNSFSTPPAAFPTPESIAAYPKFFRVDQPVEEIDDDEEVEEKEDEDMLDQDKLQRAKKKQRQGSQVLCRRLSVLKPDVGATPTTPSDTQGSSQTPLQSTPATVGVFFQHIISSVTKLVDAERTTLFMYDKETDELCAQVSIGEAEVRIPSNKGVAGSVFTSGKPANVSDSSEVDRSTGRTRYVICAPIVVGSKKTMQQSQQNDEKIVGVIEVLNKHTGPFTKIDEAHLKTIAELVSIFLMEQLENYYLIQENSEEDEEEAIKKILLNHVLLLAPSSYRRKSRVASNINERDPNSTALQPHEQSVIQRLLSSGGSFSLSRSSSLGLLQEDNFSSLFDEIEDISDLLTAENATNANADLLVEAPQRQLSIENLLGSFSFPSTMPPPPPPPPPQSIANTLGAPRGFQNLPNQTMLQLQRSQQNPMMQSSSQQSVLNFLNAQQQQRLQGGPNNPFTQINSPSVQTGIPQRVAQEANNDKKRKRRNEEPLQQMMNIPPLGQQQLQQQQQQQQQRLRQHPDNIPFMHFRIPRYELQFIQFDGNQGVPPPQPPQLQVSSGTQQSNIKMINSEINTRK